MLFWDTEGERSWKEEVVSELGDEDSEGERSMKAVRADGKGGGKGGKGGGMANRRLGLRIEEEQKRLCQMKW